VNDVSQAFLDAASAATELLDNPQLDIRWAQPGASKGMTVGGIASHLVQSGFESLRVALEAPAPEPSGRLLAPGRYFSGQNLDLDHEEHRANRDRANEQSQTGPAEIRRRAAAATEDLTVRLAEMSGDRLVLVNGRFTMTLDGVTTTRLVELLAHSDDLATSLDVRYVPPPKALTIVLACLTDVARRRHGDLDVLRAVARGDRTDKQIFPVF
jgi:hypothetical protein